MRSSFRSKNSLPDMRCFQGLITIAPVKILAIKKYAQDHPPDHTGKHAC